MLRKLSIFVLALLMLTLAACGTKEEVIDEVKDAVDTSAETDTEAEAEVEAPAATEVPATAVPEPEPVTIEIFYPVAVDAPIAAILDGYIAEFEADNPNITVEPVFSGGYGDVKTAIQTTIEGGGTPPAIGLMLAVDIFDLANAGVIQPVSDVAEGNDFVDDFIPAFMSNSYYDGDLYGVPFQRSVVLMYYNKDMFADAGLSAPTSWAEMAEAGKTLGEQEGVTGIQWPSGWPYWLFQPLAIGSGQNIVGDGDTDVYFDSPDVVEAVQFYIDLSAEHNAMPAGVQGVWGTAPTDFSSGTTAMILHSSGSLPGILESAEFEVGVMALPGQEAGTNATVVGGGNLYVMAGIPDDQKEAAWKFIEFLTDAERAADFSTQTGYIAARNASYDAAVMTDYLAEVPQAGDARDALAHAGAEFSIQNLGEIRTIFHDYLQQAYNGEMSAADAMAAAQADADAALADFR